MFYVCEDDMWYVFKRPRDSDNTTTANSDRAFYYYCNIYFLLILIIAITSQVAVSLRSMISAFSIFSPWNVNMGNSQG